MTLNPCLILPNAHNGKRLKILTPSHVVILITKSSFAGPKSTYWWLKGETWTEGVFHMTYTVFKFTLCGSSVAR